MILSSGSAASDKHLWNVSSMLATKDKRTKEAHICCWIKIGAGGFV